MNKNEEKGIISTNYVETIEKIKRDIITLVKKVLGVVDIKTEDEYVKAAELLTDVKRKIDRVEELRTFFVKPLNDHVKAINAGFKPVIQKYESMEQDLKRGIILYRQGVEKKRQEEEAKLQEKFEKKRDAAEAKGKPMPFAVAPTIEKQETKLETRNDGALKMSKEWKFEIIAYSELPKNIIEEVLYQAMQKGIHESVVRKEIQKGVREIKGVRIWEEESVSVSR